MPSSRSRADRDRDRIRSLDRLIARLERLGPSIGLAQATLERIELLMGAEAYREASEQLDALLETLELVGERPEVPLLLARACVTRARYHHQHGEGLGAALADLDRAIDALAEPSVTDPDLVKLEVELYVYRGRLLMQEEEGEALSSLRKAVELAREFRADGAHLVLLGARRELAVGLAQGEIDAGLRELEEAEAEALGAGQLPSIDDQMLRSTRAELLANGGRGPEALSLLGLDVDDPPDWALAQGAVTCDMADDVEGAQRLGQRLVEKRRKLFESNPGAAAIFAEALVAQAQRTPDPEERHALAQTARKVLEEFPGRLPSDSERLLATALELVSTCLEEPEDLQEVLSERATILETLVRDHGARQDLVEQVRCWLQLGDALVDMGRPEEALRHYEWARERLEAWPAALPVVQGLLPMALHAMGHAYAHMEKWLSSRRTMDEAVRLLSKQHDPQVLTNFSEVFLFRALACVSVGDPRGAVEALAEDAKRLQDLLIAGNGAEPDPSALEAVVGLYVLQAEVHVDHLEEPDEALECYDRAFKLRELVAAPEAALASIVGAKGAVLNEFGRSEEALPLLRRSLELFLSSGSVASSARTGDIALARVNIATSLSELGKPRAALTEIGQAKDALESADDVDEEELLRHQAIRTQLFFQRGEALTAVGHPLLAADEFSRAIELCEEILDEDEGDAHYEARLRLPQALLRRAHCWVDSGEHRRDARADLRRAYKLYADLLQDEARPLHRRRLREVRKLQRLLDAN